MIVELHILQNFAPSCLNRDDTNSPKECEFGGYRRARISSQCIKRSIRDYFKQSHLLSPENLAQRTKLIIKELSDRLVKMGKQTDEALKASVAAINATDKLKIKDDNKSEYLLFLGEKELDSFVNIILQNWQSLLTGDKKALPAIGKEVREALDGGKASDLALFGRMLADLPEKNIDAACQVAHAISTHKVGREFDFYTAVDDLQKEGETGAGMMGDIEFNSACYYRYANIDCKELKKNLSDDGDLAHKTVEAFIRAAVNAIPSGKQTSFAAQNKPDFVLAVVRETGTYSLANAFSNPVKEGGNLTGRSVEALVDYWERINRAYPDTGIKAKPALTTSDTALKGLETVNSIEDLVATVNKAIREDC